MTVGPESMRREADPTIVGDDRPWYLKAELWFFLLPLMLVAVIITGIFAASDVGGLGIEIAWYALMGLAVLVFPFWSWYIEPTPVDHPPGEGDGGTAEQSQPSGDAETPQGTREA